jgi:hypothetical protein
MPSSLARPPRQEHRDKGEGMNSQVSSQRSEAEDHGGDTVGAATVVGVKPPSSGYDGEERHRAHGRTAKHSTWGRCRGCKPVVWLMRQQRYHRKHREAGAEAPARPTGEDRASRARSTGRSSEAMAMNGGKADGSPWSDESAWRGRAIAPHGGGGARRNRARKSSTIRNRQRGLGLENDRVRGQPAGPG